VFEVQHRFIEVNGIRMHLAEQGSGPLVLLCHGFPESWYSWRHQLQALARAGYRAVAPDMRGYGRTDRPAGPDQYTVPRVVGDVIGILDHLGEETAAVVGHDWGASVAWNTALMRPDRVRGVVGLSVPYSPRTSVCRTDLIRQVAGDDFYVLYFQTPGVVEVELERDVRETLTTLLVYASGDAPEGVGWNATVPAGGFLAYERRPTALPAWLTPADINYLTGEFERTGFRGGLNWYRAMDLSWELLAAFSGARILTSALYISGDRDVVLTSPGTSEQLARLRSVVPDLRGWLTLHDCGHWIQQERPADVNEAIIDFLSGL
jgi:pimeloyl-ACP methyl ester carboxylesterase